MQFGNFVTLLLIIDTHSNGIGVGKQLENWDIYKIKNAREMQHFA